MKTRAGVLILAIMIAFTWLCPLFAQNREIFNSNGPAVTSSKNLFMNPLFFETKDKGLFRSAINSYTVAAALKKREGRDFIREEWREFLGFDAFSPYFKVQEVQKYVSQKSATNFFNFKGRAEIAEDAKSVKYIFRKKF